MQDGEISEHRRKNMRAEPIRRGDPQCSFELLRLSGELADTTLLAASSGAAYIRFARTQVERGLAKAGRELRFEQNKDDWHSRQESRRDRVRRAKDGRARMKFKMKGGFDDS